MSKAGTEKQQDRAGAEEAPARGRGRPRSEKADQAILAAALRMVADVGVAATTIEGVAAEAGVGKTTVYRRWRSKTDLIVAAVAAMAPRGAAPDTGSLRGDLDLFVATQRERLSSSGLHLVAPRILAESMNDPELHQAYLDQVMLPIRGVIRTLIERGVERGELRADTDVEAVVDVLQAVPIYRIMFMRGHPDALAPLPEPYLSLLLEGISSSSEAPASARRRSSGSSRGKRAPSG